MRSQIVSLVILTAALTVTAASAQEFSAEGSARDGAGHDITTKIYVGRGKARVESSDGSVMLADLKTKVVYVLNPTQKTYVRQGADVAGSMLVPFLVGATPCGSNPRSKAKANCKMAGRESVNGRDTEKWEVDATAGAHTVHEEIWIDAVLRVMVRMEFKGWFSEMKSVKEGPQPASLFEMPAGYRESTPGGR